MAAEHFDVLIMGAGLSGIGAAHHLNQLCPKKSYVILEQRERIGGTWDLFRYPGRASTITFASGIRSSAPPGSRPKQNGPWKLCAPPPTGAKNQSP